MPPDSEPLLYYSKRVKDGELAGLTHWILFSAEEGIYATNLVNGQKHAQLVVANVTDVTAMAVDSNQGYLFVAIQDDEDSSHIDRYHFKIANDVRPPLMSVNTTTKLEVYLGKVISSLAVDGDQSILYVADTLAERIDQVQYDARTLDLANTVSGVTSQVYEGLANFDKLTALAVDKTGEIYWTVSEGGSTDGSIVRARADDPKTTSIRKVSMALDGAHDLAYETDFVLFAGKDEGDGAGARSAVYYKSIPRNGQQSLSVKRITSDLDDCVGLGAFDSYIYVADAVQGILAVESFGDDIFSTPRAIPLQLDGGKAVPKPTTMVTFTLGALANATVSLVALAAVACTILF